MLLVDTTVWVDFFAGRDTPQAGALQHAISESEDICICGVILTEILQRIRNETEYGRTRELLDNLVFIPMSRDTFIKAAEIYRVLRRKGITVRKPIDCMIAAVAIEHGIPLLHNDKDFLPIAEHCGLRIL